MTRRSLASLGAAGLLLAAAGCSTSGTVPSAVEAHAHGGDSAASDHSGGKMGAHGCEMHHAIDEMRAILGRTQDATDPAQLRAALDDIAAQLDAMQESKAQCKSKMHGKH